MSAKFIKWVGGKTKVLPALDKYFKAAFSKDSNYIEPFIGGGSVLFHVLQQYGDKISSAAIADMCPALINAYRQARDHGEEIANTLISLESGFKSKTEAEREPILHYTREVQSLQTARHIGECC